jgi:hypothetical protein
MSAYLWTDPDMDGLQFCATHGCGELVTVHDCGTYAALATENNRGSRIEHFATAELARRAAEDRLWRKGVTP